MMAFGSTFVRVLSGSLISVPSATRALIIRRPQSASLSVWVSVTSRWTTEMGQKRFEKRLLLVDPNDGGPALKKIKVTT